MSALWNRKIEFLVKVRQRLTPALAPSRSHDDPFQDIADFRFSDLRINASLNKSRSRDVENTGSVTVTNLSISEVHKILSTKQYYQLTYTLRAGYQPQEDAIQDLPIVSEGYIMETSWGHEGGNVSMTFYTTERSKKASAAEALAQFVAVKGDSVWKTVERLEGQGFEFIFLVAGGREEMKQRLSAHKQIFPVYFTPGQDAIKPFNEILRTINFAAYYDNSKVVIHPDNVIGGNLAGLRQREISRTGAVKNKERLNFKNGLISASAEHSFDFTTNTGIPWVHFTALFRPHLYPGNFMEITEERYKTLLGGEYLIESVSITLDNEIGTFQSSGKAVHLDFYNFNLQSTYRDFLVKYRRKIK